MKSVLVKCSSPGWKKSFESLEECFQEFSKYVCKSCLITESEWKEIVDKEPSAPSDIIGYTMQEAWEDGCHEAIPDDWTEWPTWSKIQLLQGTPCGLEFEFYVEDV